MPPISVVICCADVQDTLESACASVSWADELVIVDSGSRDGTADIARRWTDRYECEPWRGYTGQKKYAAGLASHAWVFLLDADEACSPELAAQWRAMNEPALERVDVLEVPRRNYVMGRPVRAWWPDWQTRIYHRERTRWSDEVLHDARRAGERSRRGKLSGPIEHKKHSHAGFADYFSGQRMDERLLMVARQMHARGRRARPWDLLLRPAAAFAKFYLVKRGFRDGAFGLLIAQKAAVSAQLKYAALWAVNHGVEPGARGSVKPDPSSPPAGP